MMFLTKILLRIYILSILPTAVTGTNSSEIGFVALLNSDIPITNSDSVLSLFIDLDDANRNQTAEHTKKIPEKRKHNLEIDSGCQLPKRSRMTKKKLPYGFLGGNAVEYLGEFRHELPNTFLNSDNFFDYQLYDLYFSQKVPVFIKEFCSKEQFENINTDVFSRSYEIVEKNLKKLEVYLRRVVAEYVEINKGYEKNNPERRFNMYENLNKTLDSARTKGFYYLLIYSLYGTGLISVPRCMDAVEKIFLNIITYTRLMAYMHNDQVKEEIKPKKLNPSRHVPSKIPKSKQSSYYRSNFIYTDFTKALSGKPFKKYDVFRKNVDLLRKEISDNIQLIIDEEFKYFPRYKKMCEAYNSKALEFNKNILFERYPFKIGNHVADDYLREDLDYDSVIYVNGYPKNILSCLMDTDTKNQIKNLADIRLKSVFILIFISKLCLCNVTDLCTLPEYLILIGSLQEAYHEHKAEPDKSIANFQSLLSYLFSLHYLDKEQAEKRREEAKKIIENVFPEYNEIFPNFDSEINNLKHE